MEGIELVCFKMISALGAAKSSFMEAVQEARLGHFEEARRCIEEGDKY
ncbi:TPA: PTS lactose/cellobiose transporter subunit IIA, partial [Streptococcus pyogenes]|nr:PTS lactose/cellobiose transporter subunit IIA [Streptococcus pyogenes]